MSKIKLGTEEIILDEKALEFNEHTINDFLQKYSATYAYYAKKHADAQYILGRYEDAAEAIEAKKFIEYKTIGGSDKLCEAKTQDDPEVQDALEKARVSRHAVNALWGHLKALAFAHQSVLNLGWNIRKEIDGLNATIRKSHYD